MKNAITANNFNCVKQCFDLGLQVEGHLKDAMTKQLQEDYNDHHLATRDAWDFLQVHLTCCGASNYSDYVNSSWANETVSVFPRPQLR